MANVNMLSSKCYFILILVSTILTSIKNVKGFQADSSGNRLDNIFERGPFVGGDMVLNSAQLRGITESLTGYRSGLRDITVRWPKGIIPYVLDPAFTSSERSIIYNGMNMIQELTVIRLVPRTSEPSYVFIRRGEPGSGCWSNVGRNITGINILNLEDDGCIYEGVIAHELIHTIGFYHEQSRNDRDDYVMIFWNSVDPSQQHNFYKWPKDYVNDFGVPYDYQSVMHYSQYEFSQDGRTPTMLPYKGDPLRFQLGQTDRLTEYDAQKINAMYADLVTG